MFLCVFDEKRALNNTIINKIGDWMMSFDEFVFSFFRLFFFIFKKRRVRRRVKIITQTEKKKKKKTKRYEQTQRGPEERGSGIRCGHSDDQHERDKISEEVRVELTSGGDGLFGTSTKIDCVVVEWWWCVFGIDFGNVFPEVPIGRDEEKNGHG